MRLHNIIEELYGRYGGTALQKSVNKVRENYENIAQFTFGNIEDIAPNEATELYKYATELGKCNLFSQPYRVVSYAFLINDSERNTNNNIISFMEERTDGSKHFDIYCFASQSAFNKKDPANKLAHACLNATIHFDQQSGIVGGKFFLWKDFALSDDDKQKFDAFIIDHTDRCAERFLVLTSILNAKGVELKTHSAPIKLNEKRQKRGLLPINDINEIVIKVGAKTYSADGSEKGSHASPRMHWRRGHVRRLPSGEITNVRPCLVGDVGGEAPALPSYRVAMGGK